MIIKKFLADAGIYVGASAISKTIPFLLIPLFTKYLTPEDYGMLGVFSATVGFLSIVIGLNNFIFPIAKYFYFEKHILYEYNTGALFIISLTLLISLVIISILKLLCFDYFPYWALVIAVIMGAIGSILNLYFSMLQMERKSLQFGLMQVFQSILAGFIPLGTVILWMQRWEGKVVGDFLATLFIGIITLNLLKQYTVLKISWQKIKELVAYCFPLTFHALGLWGITSIGRYFLVEMATLEEVGMFTVAYSFGMIIGILHDSLLKVWNPFFYSNLKFGNIKMIIKYTYYYWLFSVVIYLLFIFATNMLYHIMVDVRYVDSYKYLPLIALAYTINGFTKTVTGYLYEANKTKELSFITLISFLLNLLLNYVLIKIYGSIGAAYSIAATFLFQFILIFYLSTKHYKINWV